MAEKDRFSIAYRLVRFLFFLLYFPFVKKINGIQNFPLEGAFIVASNHASIIDSTLLGAFLTRILDRHMHFLALAKYYSNPLTRYILELTQSIKMKKGEEARSLFTALGYLQHKEIIGIFPEMYRSPDGKIKKGKSGVASLALTAKVPVIPVGLLGTYQIMPRGKFILRPARCEINIGAPLEFNEFYDEYNKAMDQKEQAKIAEIEEKVVRIIMKEIARLSNQEYPF